MYVHLEWDVLRARRTESSENQEALLIPLINHPTGVRVLPCRFQQSSGAARHQGECFRRGFLRS